MAEISVSAIGNGAYRVVEGTRARVAYAAVSGDACWVFLDGEVYVVDLAGSPEGLPHPQSMAQPVHPQDVAQPLHPQSRDVAQPFRAAKKRKADEHTALAAPMPATVMTITVEPGQRVLKGDVLIVLEAMKMELPVRSPRDATVKRIACRPGELVQPGVPLLELE